MFEFPFLYFDGSRYMAVTLDKGCLSFSTDNIGNLSMDSEVHPLITKTGKDTLQIDLSVLDYKEELCRDGMNDEDFLKKAINVINEIDREAIPVYVTSRNALRRIAFNRDGEWKITNGTKLPNEYKNPPIKVEMTFSRRFNTGPFDWEGTVIVNGCMKKSFSVQACDDYHRAAQMIMRNVEAMEVFSNLHEYGMLHIVLDEKERLIAKQIIAAPHEGVRVEDIGIISPEIFHPILKQRTAFVFTEIDEIMSDYNAPETLITTSQFVEGSCVDEKDYSLSPKEDKDAYIKESSISAAISILGYLYGMEASEKGGIWGLPEEDKNFVKVINGITGKSSADYIKKMEAENSVSASI